MSLPGQPTEEALAEVGSEAGKSLLRGLGKLGNAYVSEWTAKREAKAEATRLAIELDAQIKKDATLAEARRENELAEFEHKAALERRAQRFRIEMAREQMNLEAIERRALRYTDRDPENGNPREIDEDWLFRFADIAQKVSDEDVQSLWARALSSAAIRGNPKLSAAGLQTLGLFDKDIAQNFRKFVAVYSRLGGFVPPVPRGEKEPQSIDLTTLHELGLIREAIRNEPYEFEDFAFERPQTNNLGLGLMQGELSLTKRGYEIASAVFHSSEELALSDEHEQQYLQRVLHDQLKSGRHVTIIPKVGEGDSTVSVRLTNKNNPTESVERSDWKVSDGARGLSDRLRKLLEWAEQNYEIEIK